MPLKSLVHESRAKSNDTYEPANKYPDIPDLRAANRNSITKGIIVSNQRHLSCRAIIPGGCINEAQQLKDKTTK